MAHELDLESAASIGAHELRDTTDITVSPALEGRNRLTCAFRPILAIPHVLLVGAPLVLGFWFGAGGEHQPGMGWGAGPGALGAVAGVAGLISWFAIVFTGRHPPGLWRMAAFYLRWRVRALAYFLMLRDEYPPFDDSAYPATLRLTAPATARDRVSVAFRIFLAIPHILLVALLGVAVLFTSIVAWIAILATGRFPVQLYHFAAGFVRWSIRMEAYVLLLRDEYPPFSLE